MEIETGRKLIKERNFKDAEKYFLNLLNKGNKDINVFFFLGLIYSELSNIKKSVFYYNKCLKQSPNSINVLLNLAYVYQSFGKIDYAKKIYIKIIFLNKSTIRAYYGLFTLNPNFLNNEHYSNIFEVIKNDKLSFYEKGLANFLLSKIEKEKKNYKLEIEYLKNFHLNSFKENHQSNIESQIYYNNIIPNFFNKIQFNNFDISLNFKSISPIFIVGLPRSGSTLVEAIITSGVNNIKSFGESAIFNMAIINQLEKKIFQKNFNYDEYKLNIDYVLFQNFVTSKYNQLCNFKKKNFNFLDKSLENFFNIELILKIFPKAKFLHCKRDLKDSVLAIYQSMLSNFSWTHNISDILNYIENYIFVINYFKKYYPDNIMDVNLEELTNDEENVAKKIYNFCNFSWDKKSLEFYKREDLDIRTLSNFQLRTKISKYDKKKYENYNFLLENYKSKFSWL
tara:strand:+ start:6451 stop:7806 length:1356 start_codon:yes stop_codon:yes gene_type:complete